MFRVRTGFFLLSLIALLAGVVIASTTASAEEKIEAPYWKVEGKRLEVEQIRKAAFEIGSEETIMKTQTKEGTLEIRCSGLSSKESTLIGSKPGSDLQLAATLLLKGCTLWVSGTLQAGCGVADIETPKLAVKGWYEGTKTAQGTKLVLLFEEQLIAIVTIKATKLCPQAGTYTLEGSFAANLEPQDSEVKKAAVKLPSPQIKTVWQAQGAKEEKLPKLSFAGQPATLQGQLLLGLEPSALFGGFSV